MLTIRTACLAAVLAATLPSAVFAHAHLVRAIPADNATVAEPPQQLDLFFSEALVAQFSGVALFRDDQSVATGAISLGSDDTEMIVPIATPLPAGAYRVDWHALSTDGHKSEGSYRFQIGS